MTGCIRFTFGIYFCCFNYFILCLRFSEVSDHFAFTGCNATLQWILVNKSSKLKDVIVRIHDVTGNVIVSTRNDQCTSRYELAVKCTISQKNEDWIILLSLLNLTTNHSGNYTAWIKEELHFETMTKQLIVIDTPQIRELGKPIHHEAFAVTCYTSNVPDCLTYQWNINGAALNDTSHVQINSSALTYTNLTMMDNLSKLVCSVGMGNCHIIGYNCSSEESEPYTVMLYYGPNKVYLTISNRDIYLQENDTFRVKCWANCYPNCTFRWESYYLNVDNDDLVINSFKERLSGSYTCTATNTETGVTSKSNPIFLRHVKVSLNNGNKENPQVYYIGLGLLTILSTVIIAGIIYFVTHRSKYAPRSIESREVCQANVGQGENKVSPNRLDRKLPILALQRNTSKRTKRLEYPNEYRISKELQNISDQTESSRNMVGSDNFWIYGNVTNNVIPTNAHPAGNSSEQLFYDYADVHRSEENYITAISDLACPLNIVQKEEIDLLETDHTYITPTDDPANPVEIYWNENTVINENDTNYITPVA